MRNLKKLLAVVLTVVMIASMMVPALAANTYEDEALKLQSIGMFAGEPADLKLEEGVSRIQGLAFAIRAAGKEADAFAMTDEEVTTILADWTDAATIPAWGLKYAAYAIKNTITVGTSATEKIFGGLDPISGTSFLVFLMKAGMGYADVTTATVIEASVDAGILTAGQAANFGAKAALIRDDAAGILYGAAMNGVNADGTALIEALIASGFVDRDAALAAGFVEEVVPEDLEVVSVTALNLKQIEIVYNKAVDEDSAEDDSNYSLDATYELQDDGVTVIATLDAAMDNQSEEDLTIEDIEAIDGDELAKTTIEDIEFLDMTIPEAVSAEVVGKSTIKVTFTEPINIDDPIALSTSQLRKGFTLKDASGKTNYVNTVTFESNNTVAKVAFYTSFKEEVYSLTVNNEYKDYAGYAVIKTAFEVPVSVDETAPEVIGFEDAKPYSVTLLFDEDIAIESDDVDDYYHTNSNNPVETIVIGAADDVDTGVRVVDGTKLELTWAPADKMPAGTVYVYIAKEAIKDLWDNENPQQIMVKIDVVGDSDAPEITKIEATAQNELEITFNEKIGEAGRADFKILDSDGDEVKNVVRSVSVGGKDNKVVTLSLRQDLSGEYTLVVEDVEDVYENAMKKTTMEFEVDDVTAPDFADFTAKLHGTFTYDAGDEEYTDGEQTLVVNFGEAMATTGIYSVLDLSKYIVSGKDNKDAAKEYALDDIDDGISISISEDGKKVEIVLDNEEAQICFTQGTLKLARVADAAGNKTVALSDTITITGAGTIGVDSFEAVSVTEIELTLDGTLADFAEEDYVISVGGIEIGFDESDTMGEIVVDEERDSDGNTVVIFRLLDDELDADGTFGGAAITISSGADPTSEDSYGAVIDFTDVAMDDKIAPELIEDDEDTDDDEAFTILAGSNTVTIEFTEPVKATSPALAATDLVVEADGEILVPGVDYILGTIDGSSEFVDLTLSGDYATFDGEVYISTKATVNYIMDANDNKLAEIEDRMFETSIDPLVKSVTEKAGNKIVIKFTEEIDAATLIQANFVYTGTAVIDDFEVNDDNDEVTITLDAAPEDGNTIEISGIKDMVDNDLATVTFTRTAGEW